MLLISLCKRIPRLFFIKRFIKYSSNSGIGLGMHQETDELMKYAYDENYPIFLICYVKTFRNHFPTKHAGEMAVKRAAEFLQSQKFITIEKNLGFNVIYIKSRPSASCYFMENEIRRANLQISKIAIENNHMQSKITNREKKFLHFIVDKKYAELYQCESFGKGYFPSEKITSISKTMLKLWKKGLIRIIRVSNAFLAIPNKIRITIALNKAEYTGIRVEMAEVEDELTYYSWIEHGPESSI